VNPSIPPPQRASITRDNSTALVEILDGLGVNWHPVTPTPWWGDEECGYCPEPADPGLTTIQPAIAWVAYEHHVGSAHDVGVRRDPACLDCLRRAVRDKRPHYLRVWVEVPA
jgi:hypothetical protein